MGINDYIKIGSRIKEVRVSKGITQRKIATQLNMPFSTYSNYENDYREPTLETLQNIANFLDVSIDYLLGLTNDPKSDIWKERQAKSLNELDKELATKLDTLTSDEQISLLSALNITIEYISRIDNDTKQRETIKSLSNIIDSFGEMILKGWEMKYDSIDSPTDYLLFLRNYETATKQLANHKEAIIKSTLNELDDDTKLRELIYGEIKKEKEPSE